MWKDILQKYRDQQEMKVGEANLIDTEGWNTGPNEIVRPDRKFFRVIGARVANAVREVKAWFQPLVEEVGVGVLVLVTNTMHSKYLFAMRAEPGNPDTKKYVLLGCPLQASKSNLEAAHGGKLPPRSELYSNPDVIWADAWKDGGRFYRSMNRLGVLALEDSKFEEMVKTTLPNEIVLTREEAKEALLAGELNSHLREALGLALL